MDLRHFSDCLNFLMKQILWNTLHFIMKNEHKKNINKTSKHTNTTLKFCLQKNTRLIESNISAFQTPDNFVSFASVGNHFNKTTPETTCLLGKIMTLRSWDKHNNQYDRSICARFHPSLNHEFQDKSRNVEIISGGPDLLQCSLQQLNDKKIHSLSNLKKREQ